MKLPKNKFKSRNVAPFLFFDLTQEVADEKIIGGSRARASGVAQGAETCPVQ